MSDGPKDKIIQALKAHGVNPDERGSLVERLLNIIIWELVGGNSGTPGVSIRVDESERTRGVSIFTVVDTRGTEPRNRVFYSTDAAWIKGLPKPKTPGVYWNPEASKTKLFTLTQEGQWLLNNPAKVIHPSVVPDDLVMLGAL